MTEKDCPCTNKCDNHDNCEVCRASHVTKGYATFCDRLKMRPEVIASFHLMWGNFPEPVLLILKNREIVAINKVSEESGIKVGTKCSDMQPPQRHQGCRSNEAFETRKAVGNKRGMVYALWVPIDGYPEYLVHFPVGAMGQYLEKA
jgi:hypothetical protein